MCSGVCPRLLRKSRNAPPPTSVIIIERGFNKFAQIVSGVSAKKISVSVYNVQDDVSLFKNNERKVGKEDRVLSRICYAAQTFKYVQHSELLKN